MTLNRPLVLDACCLINLHASGRIAAITRSLPVQVYLTETVRTRELLQLQPLDLLNPEGERFRDLIDSDLIQIVDFADDPERLALLNYAAVMGDDGEAASFAIAGARRYAVATDDKRARRFAASELPTIPLFYTLDLLKHWASAGHISGSDIRQVLINIRDHGRYVPAHSHPSRPWWDTYIQ